MDDGVKTAHRKVAAIVLNYNGGQAVLETVASLLAGSVRPSIYIVDNASTDESLSLLQARFPESRFLLNPANLGFAAGMNVGLRAAFETDAQFFWLLNNDCVVAEDTLEALLAAEAGGPTLLSPAIMTPQGTPWFLGGHISYARMRTEHVPAMPRQDAFLTGCALFIPRVIIEQAGFLDEKYFLYYEDAEYSLRVGRAGFPLAVASDARVVHAEQSLDNPDKNYWLVRSGIRFFRTHSPGYWKFWTRFYLALRKIKNAGKRFLSPADAQAAKVHQAYLDASSDRL